MLRTSEDWYQPFNWGFREIELDREALRNYRVVLLACEARFQDGTKLSIPSDGVPDPVKLKDDVLARGDGMEILLGVPRYRYEEGRANVAASAESDHGRFRVESRRTEDDTTGANEQEIEFRRLKCRLLLGGYPHDGYETMPLARVILAEENTPILDPGFVPPLLIMDASPPLLNQVRRLHHRISSQIDALVAKLPGTGRLYETQDTGEAERVLKLAVLNGAFSHFGSVAYTHGMTPLFVYQELCRLAGHLSIFMPARRPGNLPLYRHDALADCFARVIYAINRGLDAIPISTYKMSYFEEQFDSPAQASEVDRLRVVFDPDWRTGNRMIYFGVEGVDTELSSPDCQELLRAIDMKLGGASKVESYYQERLEGIRLVPMGSDRPRLLPSGFVYYRIGGEPSVWQDVINTKFMVLRFTPAQVKSEVSRAGVTEGAPDSAAKWIVRVLRVTARDGDDEAWRKISFALFVV